MIFFVVGELLVELLTLCLDDCDDLIHKALVKLVMEDWAHNSSPLRPLPPLRKRHPIPKHPNPVLNEISLFDIQFAVILKVKSEELWVGEDDEDLVETVCDESAHAWVGVVGEFGEMVLVAGCIERLRGQVEGAY